MDQHHYFLRNYYHTMQNQGFSNAAISASLAKYYSEHQARAQRANSLRSSRDPSQFAELSSIPCDRTDSDDEIIGDLFESNEIFDFFDFDPVDTSSAVMHPERTDMMMSQQSMCLTPPPPKRDSFVKQMRQNSQHNFCELDCDWVFDETDFVVDNVDIPSMQGEDTTCGHPVDCPHVSVPLVHTPNQELSYRSRVRTRGFNTHTDANVSTATRVGHFPEQHQYATAMEKSTMATKRRRVAPPSSELHTSEEQELASMQKIETEETFEALPLTRKRPFKNEREKRRRDVIKDKYDMLYKICQEIASKTGIMPALRNDDDPNKAKKSRQKLEILGDVISLIENMQKNITRLRTRNKRLKSHHSAHF